MLKTKLVVSLLAAMPIAVFAFSGANPANPGPPPRRTGLQVDGGLDCSACHRTFAPANSDSRGSVSIDAADYTPGVKQTIKVTIKHPEAARFGFQLTARLASDPSKPAGNFASNAIAQVRCDPTGNAPCNGSLEFVEHILAVRTDAGAGYTFEVEWTAPSTNVGPVLFAAAGNAANGDGTNNNDRIYTTTKTIDAPCSLTAKPSIAAIANGASLKGGAVGPNEIISIFGSNFAAAGSKRSVSGSDFVSGKFPSKFACIAVEIDGKRVPITYVQDNQINLQAPTITNTGNVSVRVIANPDVSNAVNSDSTTVVFQREAPGLFTWDGKSVAATQSGKLIANPSLLASASPAKPGDVVTMYGTGFGFTEPVYQAGEIADGIARITAPYSLSIGGTTLAAADITYVGLSPQSISGLYQVNFRVPTTAPDGDLPIVLTVNGQRSQDGVFIPVKK